MKFSQEKFDKDVPIQFSAIMDFFEPNVGSSSFVKRGHK